ncbi:magnesium transporter [Propionimicrobium lymphophilum]|uniref:magnesium transporter n=1 Tax=Propionimicrobium lymphophilum TaxID=33012 RepID=UPI003EC8FBE7
MYLKNIDSLESRVRRALQKENLNLVRRILSSATPRQAAAVMERSNFYDRALIYRTLPKDVAVAVFELLDPALQADLVKALQDEEVKAVVESMDPHDRAELLDELPAKVATRLIEGLSPAERDLTGIILGYPEESIGRRMNPEFVSFKPNELAGDAMKRIRMVLDDVETVYTIPVVGEGRELLGVFSLRDLMRVEPDTQIGEIMKTADKGLATEDAEEVARRCANRHRLALPIVDQENRLVGVLSIEDALDILEEETSEDQARISGSEPLSRPYLATPIFELVKARVVWLLVLAIGGTLTIHVLEAFEATIAQMVVLSVFVPLLIGTGGNTGNQAATTVTRAIALGDVRKGDVWKVITREIRVGAFLGLLLGLLGFVVTSIFYDLQIGVVIGLTLLSVCTLAATVGGSMPLVARKLGIDPAVFANPFISTLVDASGLIIYFLIAKAVIGI